MRNSHLKITARNWITLLCLLIAVACPVRTQSVVDYKSQIDPIFAKYNCKGCHGGDGGLFVDTYQHLFSTGFHAPVVVPRDTDCVLVRRLKGLTQPRMPQSGPISSAELQLIVQWVKEGASETATLVQSHETFVPRFALDQNYPNPFNPSTAIRFSIPRSAYVVVTVYNIMGDELETLVAQELPGGTYSSMFDAGKYATGLYIYTIRAGEFNQARTMMLLK